MHNFKLICQRTVVVLFFLMGITDNVMGEDVMRTPEQQKLTISDIPQEKWDDLAQKKIFFGHQSVGYNIITGIEQMVKEHPNIRLKFVKTTQADDVKGPVFAHDWIGKNMHPESKINAFRKILQGGLGEKIDIAFMKMCYVDVTSSTNIQKLVQEYTQNMAELGSQFSDITFIHLTVPLTAQPKGVQAIKQTGKSVIKKIIGKPVFDYKDNINRNKLNEMLKAEYADKAPFFDLALLEAAGLDGEPSFFIHDGGQIMTLANEYTNDGGHLNAEGSRRIAEQLLIFLTNLK